MSTAEQRIQPYYLAENDKKKVLVTFADQGAEVKEATYVLRGEDIVLTYGDGRVCCLPLVPQGYQPVLQTAPQILIVETTKEGLARAYDAKNAAHSAAAPKKRPRKRL